MKKHLFVIASALTLALAFALGLRAEEKTKEKMKSAEKPAKEMNYTAECPGSCVFSIKSHDKTEVAAILREHARSQHHIEMSDQDVETAIKAHAIRKEKAKE
jgi:predicted small metal-binding protein